MRKSKFPLIRAMFSRPKGASPVVDSPPPAVVPSARVESRDTPEAEPDVIGFVERLGACACSGWAVSRAGAGIDIVLDCDGMPYRPKVSWHERGDVSASLGSDYRRPGFKADYPPALRRRLREDAAALERLHVYTNQVPLSLAATATIDRCAARQRPPLLPAVPVA